MQHPTLSHLLTLASDQHGAFSTDQALMAGATPALLRTWTRSGRLERTSQHTLRVPGAPHTPQQQAILAVLDAGPGAVLSHDSGAALWDLPGFALEPHHVLAPRAGRRREHVPTLNQSLHQSLRIPEHHVVVLDGIPVTSPTRLVFDLARTLSDIRLARVADNLWARRLTTGALLHDMLRELAARGRPGIQRMRLLLEDRGPDYRPPESNLEARFQAIMRSAGILDLERQVNIGDDRGWLGRLDFLDRRRALIVEVDSDRFHTALVDKARDAAQRAALVAAGYRVLAVAEFDVWHRPWLVIDAVRAARAAQNMRIGAA